MIELDKHSIESLFDLIARADLTALDAAAALTVLPATRPRFASKEKS
jgi:hypothetical protein